MISLHWTSHPRRRNGDGNEVVEARRRWLRRVLVPLMPLLASLACSSVGTEPSRARLTVDRPRRALYHGRQDTLRATAFDAQGRVSLLPITWSSADRQIAFVDSLGVVYGNTPGRTTITATAGTLTARVDVTVRPDNGKPQIGALELSTRAIDLSSGDATVLVRVRARDAESGIRYLELAALHPTRPSNVLLNQSCLLALESGTIEDGVWSCAMTLHHYSAPGTWRVVVRVYDWRPFTPNGDSTSVSVAVTNPRTDLTPPTLDELSFTEQRVSPPGYGESRLMSVTAHDDESGVITAEYYLDSDSMPGVYGCGAERANHRTFPWQPSRVVSGTCPVPLVASITPVYRTISLVRLTDAWGNLREMRTADLERAGIVTRIDIRK